MTEKFSIEMEQNNKWSMYSVHFALFLHQQCNSYHKRGLIDKSYYVFSSTYIKICCRLSHIFYDGENQHGFLTSLL